jgi:ABC-type nickel/cobalt efflux system permease component RcnA
VTRGRRVVTLVSLAVAAFLSLSVSGAPASAHPLGNFTVNVYSGLELSPGFIRILYVVDMAEIPTFQVGPAIDADRDGRQSPEERQAWAIRRSAEMSSRLSLRVGGRAVTLREAGAAVEALYGQAGLPTLRLEVVYEAPVGESGSVVFEDRNYGDRVGWKEVTVRSTSGVAVLRSTAPVRSPSDELRAYPEDMLSSPLDVRGATFSFEPGRSSTPAAAAGTGLGQELPRGSEWSLTGLIGWRLTPAVLILSLLAAFAFGVVHALLPGHGKTITAAYLVGSAAPVRTAVVAGVAVSFMHTASVLTLGAVALLLFRSLATERVYPWLGVLTGMVALALGCALLASRVRARHRTEHGHGHEHRSVASRRGLAALALAGGILPSPTAVLVLTGAISYGRVGYGLALIVAFSLGLAAALILVGVAALRARAAVERRFEGRWVALVPVASAAAIAGVGVLLLLRGIMQVA